MLIGDGTLENNIGIMCDCFLNSFELFKAEAACFTDCEVGRELSFFFYREIFFHAF